MIGAHSKLLSASDPVDDDALDTSVAELLFSSAMRWN
jgi:hypothetical protein